MVEMYFNLVLAKKRTCDEENKEIKLVPLNLRADVLKMLSEKGYDKNGNMVIEN